MVTMDYEATRQKIREIWPALSDALTNPALHEKLRTEGLEVNRTAVQRLADEFDIRLVWGDDNRIRFSSI